MRDCNRCFPSRLLLALGVARAALTTAFETSAPPEKSPVTGPRIPAGYNGDDYCRACLHMVNELQSDLVPRLKQREEKLNTMPAGQRHRKSMHFGEVDAMAEESLEASCKTMLVQSSPGLRRACSHIVEEHGENLASALSKWHVGGRDVSELRALLCTRAARACRSSDLARVPHIEGRVGTAATPAKTSYRSERPPSINDGPVQIAVGATLGKTTDGAMDIDLVLYLHFRDERHELLGPQVVRLAQLMKALPRAPSSFSFAQIDAERNELFPPWDALRRSTVVVLSAGRPPVGDRARGGSDGGSKDSGIRIIEWLEPLERPLSEILREMMESFGAQHTKRHVANLMVQLGDERLHSNGGMPWWRDDAMLRRAGEEFEGEGTGKAGEAADGYGAPS